MKPCSKTNGIAQLSCPVGDDAAGVGAVLGLARLQGWLAPLPECPVRVDAQRIPADFLDSFRERDCASMDCRTCGYCERIAAQAVSIAPGYRAGVLERYAEMDDTMTTGTLWGV